MVDHFRDAAKKVVISKMERTTERWQTKNMEKIK